MITKLLDTCLGPVIAAEKQLKRRQLVIAVLAIGALGCAVFAGLALFVSWWSWPAVLAWFGALCLASAIGFVRIDRSTPNLRELARRIEEKHPDLRAALLAAMDQKPGPDGGLSFLQRKLLGEISEHAVRNRWVRRVSEKRLVAAGWGQFLALVAFVASLWFLLGEAPLGRVAEKAGGVLAETPETKPALEIRVTPGDVEIEKGSRLVIEANFTGRAPAAATLIHRHAGGETKIPMQAGLDDQVFSTMLPKVDTDGRYLVAYETASSDEYAISVFEYPELLQADAVVTPPAYLGGETETIADTRKITVMEGSKVEWRLRVNKPVAAAELFSEEGEILTLTPDKADPTLLLASHVPEVTRKYRVHLVDDKERSNQRPPWLTVNVKENVPPKLKLTFPGRDFDVSAVQELPLEAEVWDDVEVLRTGMSYQFRSEETEVVLNDQPLAGSAKHPLSTLIDIEKLGAKERELVTYHFWAEDKDKEGKVRRTLSDQFFAEVRLFEEIMREGAAGGGQGGTPPGGESAELIRIQKDVINAAWKLARDHQAGKPFESYAEDVGVITESQNVVIAKTDEALTKVEDAEVRTALETAKQHMTEAAAEFASVTEKKDGEFLVVAMNSAKDAYAELLKARARETEISMSQSPSQGSSQSQQEQQRNMNLELEQKELKYEEQSAAQDPALTAEQQENLAVLNRLKDLARRQEAIAEKIKELENQLQKANAEEKAEIERQLKRLEEEQRELLREMDDLAERMDSEENRANMSEEREKLDETRENVQETAGKLESGELTEAANAATRASEQLEEMKEEFREKTSRQFANEMKGLRDATRELAERQEALGEQVEKLAENPAADPFTADKQQERGELAQSIAEQSQKLSEVLESMKNLSEQAEPTEPILSDALYEAVRNANTQQVQESLDEARDMTFYNRADQAKTSAEAAARGIEELKNSVEKAAEKILGNEADALRLARNELDKLIEETKAETERLGGQEGTEEGQEKDPTGSGQPQPGESKVEAASRRLAEAKEKGKGEGKGEEPGESGAGKEPGEGEGNGESEQASTEKGKGKGKGEAPGEGQEEGQPGEGKAKGNGRGEAPGEGEGQTPSEALAENGQAKGKGKGKGEGQGEGEGETESPPEGQAENGKGKGKGKGQGEGQSPDPNATEGQGEGQGQGRSPRQLASGRGTSGGGGAMNNGGDDRNEGLPTGPLAGPLFFDDSSEERRPGPITGEDYEQWADRLGNLEEMLPDEDLRNSVAKVRDDARAMRIDFRRDDLPPSAATINQKITEPLVELRQRLSEELAKLNRENPVAPIDRDPVPSEFRDLVRRYYEELGAGK
jgi:hypothetical protein